MSTLENCGRSAPATATRLSIASRSRKPASLTPSEQETGLASSTRIVDQIANRTAILLGNDTSFSLRHCEISGQRRRLCLIMAESTLRRLVLIVNVVRVSKAQGKRVLGAKRGIAACNGRVYWDHWHWMYREQQIRHARSIIWKDTFPPVPCKRKLVAHCKIGSYVPVMQRMVQPDQAAPFFQKPRSPGWRLR